MAMFDSLKDTLNKSVAAVSVKSETLVESSRIKSAISNAQKAFYGEFASIQGIEQEIAELNARLEQIKAEEDRILGAAQKPAAPAAGSVFCTSCGKALAAGSRFCDGCGAPVT